jgi:hypothetical protein
MIAREMAVRDWPFIECLGIKSKPTFRLPLGGE